MAFSGPNETNPGARENSTAPLGGGRGVVNGPNQSTPGDRRNGTKPLGGSTGAIQPPNDQTKAPIGHSSQS